MGKDYDDTKDSDRTLRGVKEGAPAYQVESHLHIVPGADGQTTGDMTTEGDSIRSEQGDKTIEDYLALPDDRRVELIDGVFYDMAAPTPTHQDIAGDIFVQLKNFVSKNGGSCKPYISPIDVQLDRDDKTMVQPDVIVMCNRDQITKARIVGAPSLVIEVMSPSSRYMDTVRKLKKYRNAGVAEYWVILPEGQKVLVYLFEKWVVGEPVIPAEYTFKDKVPVGIWDNKCEVDFAEIAKEIEKVV